MPNDDVVSIHIRVAPELRARIGIFAEVAGVSVNTAIAESLEEAFGRVPIPDREAVLGARGKRGEGDD